MAPTSTSQPHTTLLCFIVVGLFSQIKGTCLVEQASPAASAVCAPGRRYPESSCTSCDSPRSDEVHILDIYQATENSNVNTVKVNIQSNSTVSLTLLLLNYKLVNWIINKPDSVTVSKVVLMSHTYGERSSVKFEDEEHINVEKASVTFRHKEYTPIIGYARAYFDTVTSYSAVFQTTEWWLTARKCPISSVDDHYSTSTVPPTTPDLKNCVSRNKPCWLRYDFAYESSVNECNGIRYVTEYYLDRLYYIGAILCTTTRYSLFMSTSLGETFLGIIDTDGEGQDHCAVVGLDIKLKSRINTNPIQVTQLGYYRRHWGDPFEKPTVTSGIRPQWYECGINIPQSEVLSTTHNPRTTPDITSPSTSQSFNTVAFVCILMGVVIALVVTFLFLRGCHRNQTPEPEYAMGIQARAAPPPPAQSAHREPSAPSAEPPSQAANLPRPSPPQVGRVDEEPPPAYEDIMNYPVTKTASVPSPYNHA